jgi:DNA adenine methylase
MAPAQYEVYNDADESLVRFWRVLRERPADLIRAIDLTPYSRVEQRASADPTDDDLEAARRLYVRSWQEWGYATSRWRAGWRFQHSANRGTGVADDWDTTDHLWAIAARLKRVQLECADATAVIHRFGRPDTFVYADPPYVAAATRDSAWARQAYGVPFDDDDHRRLAAALIAWGGMAAVSGYRCALMDALYAGWRRVDCQSLTLVSRPATECLWLSPAATAGRRQLGMDFGREMTV